MSYTCCVFAHVHTLRNLFVCLHCTFTSCTFFFLFLQVSNRWRSIHNWNTRLTMNRSRARNKTAKRHHQTRPRSHDGLWRDHPEVCTFNGLKDFTVRERKTFWHALEEEIFFRGSPQGTNFFSAQEKKTPCSRGWGLAAPGTYLIFMITIQYTPPGMTSVPMPSCLVLLDHALSAVGHLRAFVHRLRCAISATEGTEFHRVGSYS